MAHDMSRQEQIDAHREAAAEAKRLGHNDAAVTHEQAIAHLKAATAHDDAMIALYDAGYLIHTAGETHDEAAIDCDVCGCGIQEEDIRVDQHDNCVCPICKANDAMRIATRVANGAGGDNTATLASDAAVMANDAVLCRITVDVCILAMLTHRAAAAAHIDCVA